MSESKNNKTVLVTGAGGFIGSHLVKKLKEEGYWVVGVDLKYPEFSETNANYFFIKDLRKQEVYKDIFTTNFDEVFALASDMGGAQFCFSGDNDADIMYNNALINLNTIEACNKYRAKKVFYSSSACIYNQYNQLDPDNPECSESSAYPAYPDSEYGWEKLFSERLYLSYNRNYNLDVRISRFHNIFGKGTWQGGREKVPAALCRKIAETEYGGEIEIWGTGEQSRSFLYIDECLEGVRRLMNSDFLGPVNIGSEEMVTINQLAEYIIEISGKKISLKHIEGPLGVIGRNSNNKLIKEKLGWAPSSKLKEGLKITYEWIEEQVRERDE